MSRLNLTVLIVLTHLIGFAQETNYRKDDETVYQHYLPDENQDYTPIKLNVNFVFLHGGTINGRDYYGNFDKNNTDHMQFLDDFIEASKETFKNNFVDSYNDGTQEHNDIFNSDYLNETTIELEINKMWLETPRWDYTEIVSREMIPNFPYNDLFEEDCDCDYFYSDETSNTATIKTGLLTPNSDHYFSIRYNGLEVKYYAVDENYTDHPINTPLEVRKILCMGCTEERLVEYKVYYTPSSPSLINEEEEQITIPENVGYNELFTADNGKKYIRLESPTIYFDGINREKLGMLTLMPNHLYYLNDTVRADSNYVNGIILYFHENGDVIRALEDGTYDQWIHSERVYKTHQSMFPTADFDIQHSAYISSFFTSYHISEKDQYFKHVPPGTWRYIVSQEFIRGGVGHELGHNLGLHDDGGTIYNTTNGTKIEYNYDTHGAVQDNDQTKDVRHAVFENQRSKNARPYKDINLVNHTLGDYVRYALNSIKHSSSRLNVSQYFTNDSFDNTNLYVSQDVNEIWDFYYRSYSNIIVDGNKNLRVNDSLVMAPQSKIGIKNNSYMILDSNSRLNPLEHNDIAWQGFEIEDNSYLLILPEATIPNNFNAQVIEQGMARGETVAFEAMDQDGFPVATASILDEEKSNSILYQNTNNSSITISPNPADDYIKISSEFIPIKTVMITDMNGQLIKQTNENFDNIDISGISNGIYILNITTVDNNTEFKKVIIE